MSPVEVVDIILHAGVRRLWLWLLWDHPHSVSSAPYTFKSWLCLLLLYGTDDPGVGSGPQISVTCPWRPRSLYPTLTQERPVPGL